MKPTTMVLELDEIDIERLDPIIEEIARAHVTYVAIVSSSAAHFGEVEVLERERQVVERLTGQTRAIVFRCSPMLSEESPTTSRLRRFAFLSPLFPRSLQTSFVRVDELESAIGEEESTASAHGRVVTLLGANRPWKEWFSEHRRSGIVQFVLHGICFVFACLLIGHLFAFILNRLINWGVVSRRWNFDTLRPESIGELLALVNKYNLDSIKVVGYNNGVVHFGHRYPGKPVILTVHCNRVERIDENTIKVDCGATIRKTLDFLAPESQELYVIPNYSYVSMGTAFFVPIHGSAADYTTVAETITKVVLYDPNENKLIVTTRDEPNFQRYVYDMTSDVLLLRLYLRVKAKSRYFLHKEKLTNPTAQTLLAALRDESATNVEIRKSNAASEEVELYKYYNDPEQTQSDVLELPRDKLGRLWDKLEENAVTSWLFHALTRYLAWHVELFFTDEEFVTFWETHRELPIKKLQLRYIHQDGYPNSPFRDHDCISADMFMFRRHRQVFEEYLDKKFDVIRSNPGKHSR